MFFTFDLCLLLYVIRLAGWLKHCNLSLSLSQRIATTHLTRLYISRVNSQSSLAALCHHWTKPNLSALRYIHRSTDTLASKVVL